MVADAEHRKGRFVTEGRVATTVELLAQHMAAHGGDPTQVTSASIDMSPAFIKGVTEVLPQARMTFDKLHVIAPASTAVDKMRRTEQVTDPGLKGLR